MTPETNQHETGSGCPTPDCSAFDSWWIENGVQIEPPVMQEAMKEVAAKGWNAAIEAADSEAWRKRDQWEEGNGYSPVKAAAAEEIGYAIRRLSLPNTEL